MDKGTRWVLFFTTLPDARLYIKFAAMVARLCLFIVCCLIGMTLSAQTSDTLYNKLADFNLAQLNGDTYGALLLGKEILTDTGRMTAKQRSNFIDRMAKAYEDNGEDDKALPLYLEVAAAEPDYFVAQRAIGYLYNDKAEEIQLKLYITPKAAPDYSALRESYKNAVLKALPHLEKAQACDPDDDTLDLVKTLYQNIGDERAVNSLDDRLSRLSKKCKDVLDDK
ncbi:MAG: hypothetical protein JST19_15480 [Bacteroidetes bacterium]|nr:hypothetical protein [Bacteroidota bacterium]